MIDIDASIDKAPPEYKDALKAEKKTYTRIHEITKAVLNGGFTEASHIVNLKVEKNMEGTSSPVEIGFCGKHMLFLALGYFYRT